MRKFAIKSIVCGALFYIFGSVHALADGEIKVLLSPGKVFPDELKYEYEAKGAKVEVVSQKDSLRFDDTHGDLQVIAPFLQQSWEKLQELYPKRDVNNENFPDLGPEPFGMKVPVLEKEMEHQNYYRANQICVANEGDYKAIAFLVHSQRRLILPDMVRYGHVDAWWRLKGQALSTVRKYGFWVTDFDYVVCKNKAQESAAAEGLLKQAAQLGLCYRNAVGPLGLLGRKVDYEDNINKLAEQMKKVFLQAALTETNTDHTSSSSSSSASASNSSSSSSSSKQTVSSEDDGDYYDHNVYLSGGGGVPLGPVNPTLGSPALYR